MKRYFYFLTFLLLWACSEDSEQSTIEPAIPTLATIIEDREISESSVIACAGSNEDPSEVTVYVYPRPGVTDIRYFETQEVDLDPNDYANYTELDVSLGGLFNDFLNVFIVSPETERWVIITFEEDGILNISNPIRFRHITQATEFLPQNVSLSNETDPIMPEFTWVDGTFDDAIIYFHVVSTANNDLLSGTYTFERNFQYYVLDNVVLNVTEEEPPNLDLGVPYNFTLLSVTEDNWVNLFSEIPFQLE